MEETMVDVKRMLEIDRIIRGLGSLVIESLAYLEMVYRETKDGTEPGDSERFDNARMGIESLGFTYDEYQEWISWKEWSDWTKNSPADLEASIREWQTRN